MFAPDDLSPEGALLRFPVRWQFANVSCFPRATLAESAQDPRRCAGEACCQSNDYLKSGKAVLGFQLVNIRMDFIFLLVQGNSQVRERRDLSPAIEPPNPNKCNRSTHSWWPSPIPFPSAFLTTLRRRTWP